MLINQSEWQERGVMSRDQFYTFALHLKEAAVRIPAEDLEDVKYDFTDGRKSFNVFIVFCAFTDPFV